VHRLKKISLLLFVLLLTLNLKAQDAIITILDQQSKQPVPFAIICFETLDGKTKNNHASDNVGKLPNTIKKRSIIAVSCVGYISKMDTIDIKQSITIFLQPTVYNLDEVVVTGQFKAVKADQSIYKIDVINSRQIADKAANNLSELLSNELNVRTSQDVTLGTNLSIQGLSGEHVKILVDGVPVIGRQDGILDLSQITLFNVDHIEVVEGPMSVVYGSNALAGAINIITKEPIHGRFIGQANTYNESVGVYNFDGNAVYRAKEHTISANGGRNFFAGYSAVDTSRSKQWKPKLQYYGNLDYVLAGNNHKLRVNTNYFNEELRNRGDVFRNQNAYMAIDEYFYTIRWNTKVDYLRTFDNQNRLEAIAAYSYYNKTKKTTTKDMVTLSEDLSSDPLSQDTTVFHNVMSRITFGNSSKDILNYQSGFEGNIDTGSGKRLNGKKRNDDYDGFLTVIFLPKRKFNTQAGFRFIHNTQFKAPLVYSLNIKYSPFSYLLFRASYGKGFRAPSLKELYLDFVDINHDITGNDQLKSEISNNFDASGIYTFQHNKHTIALDAMLFYNAFQNKIDLVRTNYATNSYTYYNVGEGNYIAKGAEVKLQYQFHPRFSFNAGMYFLGRSRIENLDNFYYSTDYTLNFNYKSLRYLFRLSAYYKYTDNWYDSSVQYTNDNVIDKVTPYYMKGYHTIDVTLSRPFFKNSIEIATGLKNLFNIKNIYSYGSAGDNPHSGTDAGNTPVGLNTDIYEILLLYLHIPPHCS
jgi:outer membrane receptor for ferrienterochelin and colicins